MAFLQILRELDLADWPTLRVGLARGWATTAEVVGAAAEKVASNPDVASPALVALASCFSDTAPDHIDDLLEDLISQAERTAAPQRSLDAWRLAQLLDARQEESIPEDLVDRAQEIYASFGYPEDMDAVSPYSPSRIDDAGRDITLLDEIDNVIAQLRSRLRAPPEGRVDGTIRPIQ